MAAPVNGGTEKGMKGMSEGAANRPLVAGDAFPTSKPPIKKQPPRSRSPGGGGGNRNKFYQGSPILEVRSRLTFGTTSSNECLHSGEGPALPTTPGAINGLDSPLLLSNNGDNKKFQDVAPASLLPKSVAFGRSRRMSRSLPELRDLQFVSVLPDVEEEESDESDIRDEDEGGAGTYERPSGAVPWHRKLDFVWCSVCHALGLGNIWRFPYYCYSNGGGSFVLPYLLFMVVCGIPFLCMELAVGQLTQSGPISAFGQLCPLMKGIGVASMMLSFWLTAYYSVLSSWTLFYTFNSFYSPPRWTRCTNTWNTNFCHDHTIDAESDSKLEAVKNAVSEATTNLEDKTEFFASTIPTGIVTAASMQFKNSSNLLKLESNVTHPAVEFLNIKLLEKSDSIGDSGELRFELLASVLFVWILTYFALRKSDFFRGTTIYVITIISHLLLFSIFLRTVALEGGKSGLKYLFQIDWDKMFSPRVLLYALAQSFHSLGVVLGPSILMGSYHKQHNNLLRDTIILTVVTLLTVLIIGCITFATIGHLALKMNKPFWTVLSDDPGNVFVIYSVVIGSMPLPSCWAVLFFLVLLFLGLDTQIKLMATLVSALKEAYKFYIKQRFQGHSLFLAAICGFCFAASIPYLMQAGIFYFQIIDYYTAVVATVIVALFEVGTLGLLYGRNNLSSCIQQMTGKSPSFYYQYSWMVLTPVAILSTLIYWCAKFSKSVIKRDYEYPQWAHIMGWILFSLTVCWIPILAVAAYRKTPKSDVLNKLRAATQPRFRSASESRWEAKPVIILNGSTVTASEFPDYKLPELPSVPNAVQTYVEKHSIIHQNDETLF